MTASRNLTIDVSTLTIGDLEDIEDIAGPEAVDALQTPGARRPMRLVRALAYIAARRADPSLTPEGARDILVSDLVGEAQLEGDPSPNGDSASA